jgi:lipopolysaccharide assembly outer membrane protein LptD (OstA)
VFVNTARGISQYEHRIDMNPSRTLSLKNSSFLSTQPERKKSHLNHTELLVCSLSKQSRVSKEFYKSKNSFLRSNSMLVVLCSLSICFAYILFPPLESFSQQRIRKKLFEEDTESAEAQKEKQKKAILEKDIAKESKVDVKAPKLEYSKDNTEIIGSGGALVSRSGLQLQADKLKYNINSKDADILGDVVISTTKGNIRADSAYFNIESETGTFNNVKFFLDQDGFQAGAKKGIKFTERRYKLYESSLTTCDCDEGRVPWRIQSKSADITQEGYAHTYGSWFYIYDVPILYSPYLGFPVKSKRSSGLLIPDIGRNNQDGFMYKQPVYFVLDGTSDMLVAPFVQTKTRIGTDIQLRKEYSLFHRAEGKITYSDESKRGGALRGIQVLPGQSPDIDNNRFGGYYYEEFRTNPDSSMIPITYVYDIHYVSDDQFLRELPDNNIGLFSSQFLTSTAFVRFGLGDFMTADLSGEYNQSIDGDNKQSDDTTLQRLPELNLSGIKSFYPFGYNPYGIKLVTKGSAGVIDFVRKTGVEGQRINLNPVFGIPFNYENYFNSNVELSLFDTYYSLKENPAPGSSANPDFDDRDNRRTFIGQYTISSALEKVYTVEKDGFLQNLTSLGVRNQDDSLNKIKHVIEPVVRYVWMPNVAQDRLPLFDRYDRIRHKSVLTYGVNSSFLGRFASVSDPDTPITELSPLINDLHMLDIDESIPKRDMSRFFMSNTNSARVSSRKGTLRELLNFSVRQSYDFLDADNGGADSIKDPFSDLYTSFDITPNNSFKFGVDGNLDTDRINYNSWGTKVLLKDDRGDIFRARYTFINPQAGQINSAVTSPDVSNFEGSAELVLTDRLKFGYYSRYDLTASQVIEQSAAIRFVSGCDCWNLDLGFTERSNPDRQQINFRINFIGLGDLTQDFLYRQAFNNNNTLNSLQ